jgi:hypothetical protein
MHEDIFDIVGEVNHEVREVLFLKEYESIRQGDIYVIRLPSATLESRTKLADIVNKTLNKYMNGFVSFKFGAIGPVTDELQLVNGISIGSRHSIRRADAGVVTIYSRSFDASPLEGPMIVADTRFTIEHPEHANYSLPEGVYQVLYQRDLRADNQRVQD